MFFGGLNGEGFYNEEYGDGYGYGEGDDDYRERSTRSYSYNPLAYHQKVNFEVKHETEKAYLLLVIDNNVEIWVPKAWCKRMNRERTNCYIWSQGFTANFRKAIEKIKGGVAI